MGTRTSEDVFYLLATRGPTHSEGMPEIEPRCPDPQSSPLPVRHCDRPLYTVPTCLTTIGCESAFTKPTCVTMTCCESAFSLLTCSSKESLKDWNIILNLHYSEINFQLLHMFLRTLQNLEDVKMFTWSKTLLTKVFKKLICRLR